ncbi:putative YccA/Bax inhibitor family protein [Xanthomonas sp. F1]
MLRSGNPALKESTFLDLHSGNVVSPGNSTVVARDSGAMTLNGTANKTGVLLMLTVLTAVFAWSQSISLDAAGNATIAPGVVGYAAGGLIGGFILAMITIFKKNWAPITAPLYALVEGFFLGSISAIYEQRFNGIVLQAVLLTFGTLFAMLFAYRSGMIKATENFKLGVVAATGALRWCTWRPWCWVSSTSRFPTSTTPAPSASCSVFSWWWSRP